MNDDAGEAAHGLPRERAGDDSEPVRYWPAAHPPAPEVAIAVRCAACGQRWQVHQRLRGFRMQCSCAAWIELPPAELPATTADSPPTTGSPTPLPPGPMLPKLPSANTTASDPQGLMQLPGHDGEVVYQRIAADLPMAPGTLRRASFSNQTRWTNRTVLEFSLLMAALLGPQLGAWLLARGGEFEPLLPFASLLSGVLVALVVAWSSPYARLGIRLAPPRRFAEALLAAALGVAIATGYMHGLQQLLPELASDPITSDPMANLIERLGLPAALLVIAVAPAVFEEIIFRGLLQGRLMALYGRGLGLLITAVVFALCHGAPAALPIHLGIGLYLGWLRERSQSLLPGMLMHLLYNGTLVLLESQ